MYISPENQFGAQFEWLQISTYIIGLIIIHLNENTFKHIFNISNYKKRLFECFYNKRLFLYYGVVLVKRVKKNENFLV